MIVRNKHFTLGLIACAAAALTACGGGGGGTDIASSALTAVNTIVMDGLIQNALVCADLNNNGLCDATEPQARSDAAGRASFSVPTANLANAPLLAMVNAGQATDADTGAVTTSFTLSAPAGQLDVISPLTSMVQNKIATDKVNGLSTSVAAAEAYVKSQTGLTNISMFDNFVARMASSSSYQTAAQVARVYVASMQKTLDSSDACVSSTMAAVVKSSSDATEKNSASSHDRETHISDDLTSHLSEVRHAADQVAKSCSATNLSKECKDLIKNLAPIMTCTTPTKPTTPITPPNPTPTTPTTPTPPATGSAQSISFTGPGNQTMGVAPPVLNATASSGLAVSYATQTPAVCTVAGSTLTLVAAGTCTVTASQAGNSSWAAATPLSQSFTVLAAATTPGASALNGKALYTANSIMACAPCHGMPPSVNKVLNGANNPNLIQNAINGGTGGMGMYNGKFSSQQIADIAAYLATPGI